VVTGDITSQRISIEDGAYFKGRVNIQKELPKKEVLRAATS
jgi:cytoskeletal protein CcmA (bactofilin family)